MSQHTESEPQDTAIVRAAIHPSIGIARVGNSEDEFYIGPEVLEPPPQPPGFSDTAQGGRRISDTLS